MKIIELTEQEELTFDKVLDGQAFRCTDNNGLYIKVRRNSNEAMAKDRVNCIYVDTWTTACLEPYKVCRPVKLTLGF